LTQPVKAALAVPENQPLVFSQHNGRVEFTLPKLTGHQMIALNLA
jgi:hypothetical protein